MENIESLCDDRHGAGYGASMARRLTRFTCVVAAAVAWSSVVVTGCSSDEGSSPPRATLPPTTTAGSTTTTESTTTVPATTTTVPLTDEEAVREAYLEAETALFEALASPSPDPADPRLLINRTPANARSMVEGMEDFSRRGRRGGYPGGTLPEVFVESVEVNGDQAVLTSCSMDDYVQIDGATGQVVDDAIAMTRQRIVLRREGERWLVDGGELLDQVEGVACTG